MKANLGMVIAAGVAALMGTAGAASAQHAGDVLLSIEGGRLVTGLIEEGGGMTTPGVRVFGAEFGEVAPDFTDEPGFDNEDGAFVPGSGISFTVHRALRRWNGSNFDDIAAEQISIGFGPITPVLTPMTDVVTPGFAVEVDAMGNWHNHLEYTLGSPASSGVYLLEMSLATTQAGVGASELFWFVFNQNEEELVHDEAIEWVEANLVPAPGAGVMMMGMLGAGLLRRRRMR